MERSCADCDTVCGLDCSNRNTWLSFALAKHPLTLSNVPGVALYFYTLTSIRTELSYLPFFSTTIPTPAAISTNQSRSTLVKLSVTGNLMAGAIARTTVGFMLNPITVLKARYEVRRLHRVYGHMGQVG